jgi:hypothetical protein
MDTRIKPAHDGGKKSFHRVGSTPAETSCTEHVESTARGHAMNSSTLKPAAELARAGNVCFPNESAEYRRAREALLAEEIELRRHIERVAEQRRALPPGGEVRKDYAFEGEKWPGIIH